MKCEKCGRELTAIELVMENFDGGNTITKHSFTEMDNGAVIVDTTPLWVGGELGLDEVHDTIACPHCGQFPFEDTEVQIDDVVRVVMFRKEDENAAN